MQLLSSPRPGHLRVAAIATVARTVPPVVAGITFLAAVPAVVVAAAGRHDFAGALTAATLLAGAGAGYAADDPAASTLASSPSTLAVRRTLRATVIVAALGAGWAVALLVASRYGHRSPDVRALAAELCAAATLSAAFASRAARSDAPVSTGFGGAAAALLVMICISSLAYRWPALPAVGAAGRQGRWWWVAGAGLLVAAWSSRDPARRRLGRG